MNTTPNTSDQMQAASFSGLSALVFNRRWRCQFRYRGSRRESAVLNFLQ